MSSSREGRGGPVWSIVVAAGSGRRFGGSKQWQQLQGRSLAAISVDTARSACDGVVLVVPPQSGSGTSTATGADSIVPGGDTRAESVRRGLSAVPAEAGIIVVHDAVRPGASIELFHAVIAEV
ncbi:MAG: 2-C-methyl-D-erythritol 4-phosphate cytidylyltransferase, partial [Actinobacteria bacterium]|nr:2-C-methyl-D-erythritol 4-phosphate cytidylyltransferase [Actinomycetota bacterium]